MTGVAASDETPSGTERSTASEGSPGRFVAYALRAAGVVLVALVLFPFYQLLDSPDAGLLPRGAIAAADLARSLLFLGSFIAIVVAILASRVLDPSAVDRTLARVGRKLVAIPTPWFAGGLALIAAAITLAFSLIVLDGRPNLSDAMVQLTHARFIAAGHLGGPSGNAFPEFWQLQNSVVTPAGWVSQYPPGYVIFLAAGLRLGMVQLVGPFFAGLTILFTALTAERLLRDDTVTARLGTLMLCFSPFLIGLAGSFMNHIGAAAFTSAAIYFAIRSRDDGKLWWAFLAGAAVGSVFSIRPLAGVVAAAVVAIVWLTVAPKSGNRIAGFLRRSLAAMAGISPLFAAVGAYNRHFFGSPFTFGYVAAEGPLMRLGFHRDPTGAFYGPLQALGYTSADLVTLSLYLLETPVPAVLLAGLFLLVSRRFSVGVRVIAIWALLPVAANAIYWHHGIFMGPRMLNEAAPPWALLTAIAATGLVRRVPSERIWGRYSPRAALALTFVLSWTAGILYLGPQRLASYGGEWMESSRVEIPRGDRASLVFVHGAWTGRVSARLLSHGMRIDSLEAALRQNTTCEAHNYSLWYSGSAADRSREAPPLDFSVVPHDVPPQVNIADGDAIRTRPGVPLSPECLREVASDTLGIVDVGPLVWQGDLPGIGSEGRMFVRDMGPEANARLIKNYPDRVPAMLRRFSGDAPPRVVPYAEGMAVLWPVR